MENQTQPQGPSFLDSLITFDIVHLFGDWLAPGGGWYIDAEDHKIKPYMYAIDPNRRWIYTNQNPKMFCNFYMDGVFSHLNFIHSRCLQCYKVVVKMHRVADLFRMYEFQKEFTKDCQGTDRFCKCGIEERPYTHNPYGAYFYNLGIEQGKLRHGQVLREMRKLFGDDAVSDVPGSWSDGKIEIILKRYCTEFELRFGPSNEYDAQRPPLADAMEEECERVFELKKIGHGQPDYVIRHNMIEWLKFAWARGDDSAKAFHNGKPFYNPVVTYHEQGGTK